MFGAVLATSGCLFWLLAYLTRQFVHERPRSAMTYGIRARLQGMRNLLIGLLFLKVGEANPSYHS